MSSRWLVPRCSPFLLAWWTRSMARLPRRCISRKRCSSFQQSGSPVLKRPAGVPVQEARAGGGGPGHSQRHEGLAQPARAVERGQRVVRQDRVEEHLALRQLGVKELGRGNRGRHLDGGVSAEDKATAAHGKLLQSVQTRGLAARKACAGNVGTVEGVPPRRRQRHPKRGGIERQRRARLQSQPGHRRPCLRKRRCCLPGSPTTQRRCSALRSKPMATRR
jgi:hypothetical protein